MKNIFYFNYLILINNDKKAIAYGGRFWAKMPLGESRFDVSIRAQLFVIFTLKIKKYQLIFL